MQKDNDTNVTSSESKKIKNDDLSSGRTVTDKGFSVNNQGFYEVINILLKIIDSAAVKICQFLTDYSNWR